MAEFSKYAPHSVGRLFLHNNRVANDGVKHSNESIQPERTFMNYHFKKGSPKDVEHRVSELFAIKKLNTAVLGEMIVTLPRDCKKDDEREFFQAIYDFYCNDFGEENIMNAVVHKDEKQPHIHIDFVPVLKGEPQYTSAEGLKALKEWQAKHDGELPQERICCKDLITRQYLMNMHTRLSDYVQESLGYKVGIQNGATENGNRTVMQLKAETLKREIEKMENQRKHLSGEINSMLTIAKSHGIKESDIGLYPLMQKIADLEQQNAVLRGLVTRQGYSWKKEDLEAMKAKKYIPAQSVSINVYDGSLVNADIDKNAVVVIELPHEKPRPSPQKKLIDGDVDLERQTKFVQSSAKPVMCRQSRTSDKIYLFIKTDNTKETMENLLFMEKQLRELDLKGRRVYMDKMDTDEYDLARSIFEKNQIEALYFANRELEEKAKGGEHTADKEITT